MGASVFETAVAQLRFAASLLFGLPIDPRSLERLVRALRETIDEFGGIGPEGSELLGGPTLDPADWRDIQLRRFRQQARRAARETVFYADLFGRLGLDPQRHGWDDLSRLPVTPKAALRDAPEAFVRATARPFLRALSTGTTGRPTTVSFSERELRVIAALSAIGFLTSGQLRPESVVQVNTSSRGTLGSLGLAGACAHIGATVILAGVIEPEQALALLAEKRPSPGKRPQASVLNAYPSYLGELVECGLRTGYRPADFGLEQIFVGGEVVTAGLKHRARRLFGDVDIAETYAMTETIPFGGTRCEAGHLHFEPVHGLVEVLDVTTGAPAGPGDLATLVTTPFPPFRETTVLLRYDTRDGVRAVGGSLGCSRRDVPATGPIEGKLDFAVRHAGGWTTPRDVLEALEALDVVPLPARCGFWSVADGVAVEVLARDDRPATRQAIEDALASRGVPLRALRLVRDRQALTHPLPLRCDLRETVFHPPAPASGAPADAARQHALAVDEGGS
jgi:phenylacetate-coenzyme A ligase PaaK-like adenylate-forming protein